MTKATQAQTTPDVKVLSGPTHSGSSETKGHDRSKTMLSEKRKVEDASAADGGGKDLVETKQTTLDDVVQHEEKADRGVQGQAEERKVEEEKVERPTKKVKTDNDGETPKKIGDDKTGDGDAAATATATATPPSQKSHKDAPGDRPHKSVKKVDNIKDKPSVSTPTKAPHSDDDDVIMATAASSSSPPAGKPGATTSSSAGAEKDESSTVPGDEAHLDHPENWTTGDDPATDKQKGYLKVLEKQRGEPMGDIEHLGKSEASEKIENAGAPPPASTSASASASAPAPAPARTAADDSSTVPGDEAHLDHPENWTTGADPATDKQKGFLKVLEKQTGVSVGDVSEIGKSEASEKIDELKNM